MSNPFTQGPLDGNPEEKDRQPESSTKNMADTKAADVQAAKGTTKDEAGLTKIDLQLTKQSGSPYSYSLNNQQAPFALKKSEFLKPISESVISNLQPLISNFLSDTKLSDEHKLSVAELKELSNKREALSGARSPYEAVEHALQLTRLYQHLKYLEEEKKARDLILGLDPQNQLDKQLFKELELMYPPDIAMAPPVLNFPGINQLSKRRLRQHIANMSGGRVVVLGDLLIDELLEGKPERISREAPVLILEHMSTELILGGAANTAANLAALGGHIHAIGICGMDEYSKKLARLLEKARISHSLIEDPLRPTTVKTRILSSAHKLRQQLLRMDRISHERVCPEIISRVLDKLKAKANSYPALILSDYRSGLITDELVSGTMQIAAETGLKVIVDAQSDFARFKGARLITPNQPDTEAAIGFKIDSPESLERAGSIMLKLSEADAILLTRGAEGMTLFQKDAQSFSLPVFNRSEIFDVTGAGDTVVATMTLSMITGASMQEAMALGNLAAGIVVKKSGTAVTNQKELLDALDLIGLAD